MIEIGNISKRFKDHQALTAVNLKIPKGTIYGLIGHNGAGKTTLIRILTQIIKADSGEILINSEKLEAKHRLSIGYLPEERGLYKKMQIKDYLIFMSKLREIPTKIAEEKILYWLKKFNLEKDKNKEINTLSKGNQQKVQFIATVFFDPQILILDEPFSGFDPANAELLKREILELNQKGTSIIFSTHQMEAVEELCQEVSMIDQSKIVLSGKLSEIKKSFGKNEYLIKTKNGFTFPKNWKINQTNNGVKLELAQNESIESYLREIGIENLLAFEALEPSLKDIFLEKVKK